jgi:hypothetical protein
MFEWLRRSAGRSRGWCENLPSQFLARFELSRFVRMIRDKKMGQSKTAPDVAVGSGFEK